MQTLLARFRRFVGLPDREAPLPFAEWEAKGVALEQRLSKEHPRIAVVKQDVCEDLYCCPPGTRGRELIESTLLRTGPVTLFTRCAADFHIVETVDDPECCIWQERANDLHWESLEFFASYRQQIPGRDYGQQRFAVAPERIDWGQYDLVVSIDVVVPARITRQFPQTAWVYYVREVKAPSYGRGLQAPANGQDLFLSHSFVLHREPAAVHVVDVPYHLHYPGCFHELFGVEWNSPRHGVFVDHHTMVTLSGERRQQLSQFGPVASPIHRDGPEVVSTAIRLPRRTMDADLRERLLTSKYFLITPGQRRVHGTALVEAIAAGCLAIGSKSWMPTHGFFFTAATNADNVEQALQRMAELDADDEAYRRELERQRRLVKWLCYVRPLTELLDRAASVRSSRR